MTDIIISGANGHMGHMIYECIKDRSDCQVVAGIDINTEKYADFPIFATPSEHFSMHFLSTVQRQVLR